MIRIAIVEDDPQYAERLQEYLNKYRKESGIGIEITRFTDGDEIAEEYSPGFDIILMDIAMRFTDSMTAARQIRLIDPNVAIIFVTNVAQYAMQGYEVEASDYILKPVSYFVFSQRLGRVIRRKELREAQYIAIPVKGGSRKLNVAHIYYVESRAHELTFHTSFGNFVTSLTMRQVEECLSGYHFFRGNNSYLINLAHVDAVQDSCAVVQGQRLQLSRPRKNAFLRALTDYMGEVLK